MNFKIAKNLAKVPVAIIVRNTQFLLPFLLLVLRDS